MAARIITCVLAASMMSCGGLHVDRSLHERSGDWPTFARDVTRTAVGEQSLSPPLVVAWEYDVTAGVGNGSPVVVDSIVFVGTLRGELYAISLATGKLIGWVGFGESIQGSPVVDGNVAFVAISNSKESLAAYDVFEGKARWKKKFGDVEVSPLLYDQKLYIGNTAGTFYCIARDDGSQNWKFELPSNTRLKGIRSSAAADSGTVIFGADDGCVYALNAESGALRWKYETGSPVTASPLIAGRTVYVGNRGGIIHAIDRASGVLRWRSDAGAPVTANAVPAGPLIVLGTTAGTAFGLQMEDGKRVWTTELGGPVIAGGALAGNVVYMGTLKKEVFALSPRDGSVVWKAAVEGRIRTSPASAAGRLLIATDDRTVIAYKETRP